MRVKTTVWALASIDTVLKEAAVLSRLCSLAYNDGDLIPKLLNQDNTLIDVVFLEEITLWNTTVQFYSWLQSIVVVFRGTERTLEDIITDVSIIKCPIDYVDGRVHRGFYTALLSVQGAVNNRLRSYLTDGKSLYVTGHSLGGALGQIFGLSLAVLGIDGLGASSIKPIVARRIITFGQPPVGGKQFGASNETYLYNILVRFVLDKDIVPRMPLLLTTLGYYSHSGLEYFMDGKGSLDIQHGYRHSCIVDILESIRQGDFKYIRDHNISNYISHINLLAQRKEERSLIIKKLTVSTI